MFDPLAPSLALLSVGLLLAGLGVLVRSRQAHRVRGTQAVPGEVVDEVHGHDAQWLPVVRFTTATGRTITGVPRSSSWHGVSRIGRTVAVHADPAQPEEFEVLAVGRSGTVLVLSGVLFLVPGLAGLLLR